MLSRTRSLMVMYSSLSSGKGIRRGPRSGGRARKRSASAAAAACASAICRALPDRAPRELQALMFGPPCLGPHVWAPVTTTSPKRMLAYVNPALDDMWKLRRRWETGAGTGHPCGALERTSPLPRDGELPLEFPCTRHTPLPWCTCQSTCNISNASHSIVMKLRCTRDAFTHHYGTQIAP
jgi:hypothetical protein